MPLPLVLPQTEIVTRDLKSLLPPIDDPTHSDYPIAVVGITSEASATKGYELMAIDTRITDIFISIALMLPLTGGIVSLLRVLISQIRGFKHLGRKGFEGIKPLTKIALTVLMIMLGSYLACILVLVIWFPQYQIPVFWRIVSLLLLIPYLSCAVSLAYITGSAIGVAGVSISRVFGKSLQSESEKDEPGKNKDRKQGHGWA